MTKRRITLALGLFITGASPLFIYPLAAQQQADRAHQIGNKFMCMCNCNQGLTQCNHVGCTTSTAMLKQIDDHLARGDSEDVITQAFVQEFGTKVYAEPPRSGFSLVAWTMPAVYLALGFVLVLFVIKRWRNRAEAMPAPLPRCGGVRDDLLERVARETQD